MGLTTPFIMNLSSYYWYIKFSMFQLGFHKQLFNQTEIDSGVLEQPVLEKIKQIMFDLWPNKKIHINLFCVLRL